MAPTEILAEQHWRKFGEWLAPLGVRLGYLRGGLREKTRKRCSPAGCSSAPTLIQDVEFARLGLAVVDEQHRFGVEQRLALRKKETPQPAAPCRTSLDERDADSAHSGDDVLRGPGRLHHRRVAARAPPGDDQAPFRQAAA